MQSVFDELGLAGTMVVVFFIRLGMLAFTTFDVLRCWLSFSHRPKEKAGSMVNDVAQPSVQS
jgi:hypothetical protein